jgi:dihydrofolate reductase
MTREMIVAYGKYDRAIGQDGGLPWGDALKSDMRRFRQCTLGKSVIMGRATYDSIGRPLAGRENIVVTHHEIDAPDVIVVHSLDEAYERARCTPIVIGGAALYLQALPTAEIIYATEINGRFPSADTFFPDLPDGFIEAFGARQPVPPDAPGGLRYEYTIYVQHLKDYLTIDSWV